jgi:hypothetical protein
MTSNECSIGTTRLPNARINEDTLLRDGMNDGDYFTVLYVVGAFDTIHYFAVTESLAIIPWPAELAYPAQVSIDGKTITPGDVIRGEHGRKFAVQGEYYQLDFSNVEPRFVLC